MRISPREKGRDKAVVSLQNYVWRKRQQIAEQIEILRAQEETLGKINFELASYFSRGPQE
jgi:hypothetical protein